jgi:hypothetical protein
MKSEKTMINGDGRSNEGTHLRAASRRSMLPRVGFGVLHAAAAEMADR